MRTTRKTLGVGLTVIVAATAGGVANAITVPDFSAPGIPSPGYVDFAALNYSASLNPTGGGGYTLTILGTNPNVGLFNFKNAAYLIGGEEVKLTVNFDATGHLVPTTANTIEIDGSLASWNKPLIGSPPAGYSWSAQKYEKLFGAVLTGVGVDSKDEALGFATADFSGWANQPQFASPNASESLWLFSLLGGLDDSKRGGKNSWDKLLDEIEDHRPLKAANFHAIGSITTVPLPGTALLLLGGLAGFGGFVRRRRAPAAA
jgi:hypothetical protein